MLFRREDNEDRNEHIDMTPMVDVVFQLMTFMLFSVQMTGGEKVDVPPARHGIGVEETAATFLSMTKPSGPGNETTLRRRGEGRSQEGRHPGRRRCSTWRDRQGCRRSGAS
jgi:hypothetical protein